MGINGKFNEYKTKEENSYLLQMKAKKVQRAGRGAVRVGLCF